MLNYAQEHFAIRIVKYEGFAKFGKTHEVPFEEMIQYSLILLGGSLTKITDKTLLEQSSAIFKTILKIMDSKKYEDPLGIKQLCQIGIDNPELRDEILIQFCKQLTPPIVPIKNWDTIQLNGWHALSIVASSFPASKTFSKFFQAFVMTSKDTHKLPSSSSESLRRYISYVEDSIRKIIINGARKYPASGFEIKAIQVKNKLSHNL